MDHARPRSQRSRARSLPPGTLPPTIPETEAETMPALAVSAHSPHSRERSQWRPRTKLQPAQTSRPTQSQNANSEPRTHRPGRSHIVSSSTQTTADFDSRTKSHSNQSTSQSNVQSNAVTSSNANSRNGSHSNSRAPSHVPRTNSTSHSKSRSHSRSHSRSTSTPSSRVCHGGRDANRTNRGGTCVMIRDETGWPMCGHCRVLMRRDYGTRTAETQTDPDPLASTEYVVLYDRSLVESPTNIPAQDFGAATRLVMTLVKVRDRFKRLAAGAGEGGVGTEGEKGGVCVDTGGVELDNDKDKIREEDDHEDKERTTETTDKAESTHTVGRKYRMRSTSLFTLDFGLASSATSIFESRTSQPPLSRSTSGSTPSLSDTESSSPTNTKFSTLRRMSTSLLPKTDRWTDKSELSPPDEVADGASIKTTRTAKTLQSVRRLTGLAPTPPTPDWWLPEPEPSRPAAETLKSPKTTATSLFEEKSPDWWVSEPPRTTPDWWLPDDAASVRTTRTARTLQSVRSIRRRGSQIVENVTGGKDWWVEEKERV